MPRPTPPPSPSPELPCHVDNNGEPDLDKVIIVVAVVCAFLCALGLNSTLRCVVRCASRAVSEPAEWVAAHRLHSGLKSKDVAALPVSVHGGCGSHNSPAASSSSSSSSGCAICLGEYSEGEKVRVLPKCNHRFHVVCIDKWLHSHSSCPTCRNRINSDSNDNILCTCLN